MYHKIKLVILVSVISIYTGLLHGADMVASEDVIIAECLHSVEMEGSIGKDLLERVAPFLYQGNERIIQELFFSQSPVRIYLNCSYVGIDSTAPGIVSFFVFISTMDAYLTRHNRPAENKESLLPYVLQYLDYLPQVESKGIVVHSQDQYARIRGILYYALYVLWPERKFGSSNSYEAFLGSADYVREFYIHQHERLIQDRSSRLGFFEKRKNIAKKRDERTKKVLALLNIFTLAEGVLDLAANLAPSVLPTGALRASSTSCQDSSECQAYTISSSHLEDPIANVLHFLNTGTAKEKNAALKAALSFCSFSGGASLEAHADTIIDAFFKMADEREETYYQHLLSALLRYNNSVFIHKLEERRADLIDRAFSSDYPMQMRLAMESIIEDLIYAGSTIFVQSLLNTSVSSVEDASDVISTQVITFFRLFNKINIAAPLLSLPCDVSEYINEAAEHYLERHCFSDQEVYKRVVDLFTYLNTIKIPFIISVDKNQRKYMFDRLEAVRVVLYVHDMIMAGRQADLTVKEPISLGRCISKEDPYGDIRALCTTASSAVIDFIELCVMEVEDPVVAAGVAAKESDDEK